MCTCILFIYIGAELSALLLSCPPFSYSIQLYHSNICLNKCFIPIFQYCIGIQTFAHSTNAFRGFFEFYKNFVHLKQMFKYVYICFLFIYVLMLTIILFTKSKKVIGFFHKNSKFSGRLFFFLVGFCRRPIVISITALTLFRLSFFG